MNTATVPTIANRHAREFEDLLHNEYLERRADPITSIHVVEDAFTGRPFVRVHRASGSTADMALLYGEYRDLADVSESDALRSVLFFFPGAAIDPDYSFRRESYQPAC